MEVVRSVKVMGRIWMGVLSEGGGECGDAEVECAEGEADHSADG